MCPPREVDVGDIAAEDELRRVPGLDRRRGPARQVVLRVEGEVDMPAGLPLEGGDDLADRRVLLGIAPLLPPDDEVGGPGAERGKHEHGGEEKGPDPHGALPARLRAPACACSRDEATCRSSGEWRALTGVLATQLELHEHRDRGATPKPATPPGAGGHA